jgi:DHA2 family methylenomycin A resistance protein-like MFS transporter
MAAADAAAASAPSRAPAGTGRRAGLAAISLGFLLITLDATIVNVALGSIDADLGGTLTTAQWIVDAYALPFAALLLMAGSLADRFGARRGFLAGLALFALGGAGCSVAPTLAALIAARALQGTGAALLMSCSLALLAHLFPLGPSRTRALAVWGGMSGIGLASGLVLGGVLVSAVGWRAVFLVNLPIAVLAALALRDIPESPRHRRALDGPGQLLGATALAVLTTAATLASARGWGAVTTLATFGAGIAATAAFLLRERLAAAPMVPMGLFANRRFSASVTIGALFNFCLYGSLFALTIVLDRTRGLSTLGTAMALLPLALVVGATTFLSGRFVRRRGEWRAIQVGLSGGLVGSVLLAVGPSDAPLGMLAAASLGIGFAALAMPAMTAIAIGTVPPPLAGLASGVLNAARQAGTVLGVAVLGAFIDVHDHGTGALHAAFAIVGACYGIGLLLVWLVGAPSR